MSNTFLQPQQNQIIIIAGNSNPMNDDIPNQTNDDILNPQAKQSNQNAVEYLSQDNL
jgi:hypothetical protein